MKIQKLEESKQDIIDFLRGLKYGDDYDFEPVGEWEVSAWVTNPSKDFPHGAYIVQVDNDSIGKSFHAGDIESQKELEYKIEKMIKKIQSLKEDKEMNEKETKLTEDLSPEEAGASGLFNDLIQREYEQLNQYDSVQITLEDQGDDRFSEILEYIKDDLNIHIGMLQSCLDDITGSGEQVDQGEAQADQVLGESFVLEESLFNEEQQAFYDYPDELVWTFFDWCAELDPYDFPYRSPQGEDIDGWEMTCKQISPDDIIEQVSEEMEYVADDPVNQELIHLGQKVIEMAQEFKKSIGTE